jgi:TolA-binding protein
MNETFFEKIEQYLNNELNHEERLNFESELAANEELASIVKLYSTIETEMRNNERHNENEIALKKTLNNLNATYFKSESRQSAKENISPVKKINLFQWLPYAIAASVIILVAMIFLNSSSPRQLAKNYIFRNLTTLSLTMQGLPGDTLQSGITAYNNKHYDSALQFFQSYYNKHPESSSAKEYIGFVYLVTKDYDRALREFDELSNIKSLYSNPGTFLKAVTLLQRNKEGDKEQAKQLLRQVVDQKSEGSREAEEWLKKM